MSELIICEKPNAAKKIAEALADNKPKKQLSREKVAYYNLTHNGKEIQVCSAVGHLYGLTQTPGTPKTYPAFEIEWAPSSELKKASAFTKKYLSTIKRLAKQASTFTIATDYDIEGEVIGINIVKYACKKNDAHRMKFSTLTKDDLIDSYKNKSKTIDWGQANAGETRHKMDWFFGINLSRALTEAIKTTGGFKLMSTGRVQGPALKLIVEKEKEIKKFVPEPYNEIELKGKINKHSITAMHKKGKIFNKQQAEKIYNTCKNQKTANIDSINKKKFSTPPPHPFDLTSLQIEAHKCLGISPKKTLQLAQTLYTNGYTSYPRTSSQQLSSKIKYVQIIKKISKQKDYLKETAILLKEKTLTPNNGKKKDPAHPAIYPTGDFPSFKDPQEKKLYDLIVRRFLATFGKAALRETITCNLDCNKEIFTARGTTTLEKGWFELYGKHVKLKETQLPNIIKTDICNIDSLKKLDKETSPPNRYTVASIIKELEKENLGTKATRANIIETLFYRGFAVERPIAATELGIRTEETLEKYSPKIMDPQLTRHFEEEMEKIRQNKKKPETVLNEVKKEITNILTNFKKNIKEIGKALYSANKETRREQSTIGNCPECKGNLVIKSGRFGRFIACDQYPKCKTTFKLPSNALAQPSKKICEHCKHPMIKLIKEGKRPQEMCIWPECPSKKQDKNGKKITPPKKITKKCPDCGNELLIRKGFYGEFIGCSNYPKCKHTERINSKKPTKKKK